MSYYHLAAALAAARLGEEALSRFEAAARSFKEAGGPDAPLAWRSLSLRAAVLARLGRLDEADREFATLASTDRPAAENAAHAVRLAFLRSRQHRHEEAIALAHSGAEGLRGTGRNASAYAESTLGQVLLAAGRHAEAIPALQRSVAIYAKVEVTTSPDHGEATAALARARAALADGVGGALVA